MPPARAHARHLVPCRELVHEALAPGIQQHGAHAPQLLRGQELGARARVGGVHKAGGVDLYLGLGFWGGLGGRARRGAAMPPRPQTAVGPASPMGRLQPEPIPSSCW